MSQIMEVNENDLPVITREPYSGIKILKVFNDFNFELTKRFEI